MCVRYTFIYALLIDFSLFVCKSRLYKYIQTFDSDPDGKTTSTIQTYSLHIFFNGLIYSERTSVYQIRTE